MTEEEIFEILRKQEEQLRKKPTFYIHYDKITHRIINFRNYLDKDDQMPHIEMTELDFNFSDPLFDIVNYMVIPSEKKLEKIVDESFKLPVISEVIFEIPKILSDKRITYADRPFDLLIEQNNPLQEFRIKLSKELKEKLSRQSLNTQLIFIYVTAPSDPNILYKTLKFTFGDIIQNEYYTIEYEDFKGNDVNIYAFKYFENYIHVDIR